MSDCSFVVLSSGRTIYEGGDEKSDIFSKRSRKSNKTDGKVIYPIFKEAIAYTQGDSFWDAILDDASRGIFPKMYKYNNGVLSFKQKNKIYSQEICQDKAVLCLTNVQVFMKSHGFYSSRDYIIKMEELNRIRAEASKVELKWKNIKSNKEKKLLISTYLTRLAKHYSLNNIEISKLINVTRMANSIGIINANSVVMKNNHIVDIEVLCYDPKTRDFFIDPNVTLPKMSKAMLKKMDTDENGYDGCDAYNDTEDEDIKPGCVNISRSRISDWKKYLTVLGKSLSTHNGLEELENKIRNLELTPSNADNSSVSNSSSTIGSPSDVSSNETSQVKKRKKIVLSIKSTS
jgi:hypothetical protein